MTLNAAPLNTGGRVTCVLGDIVRMADCEAIVNSANPNLRAGSGVCGAIHAAAGPDLEPFASRLAPLGLGHAVATPGFRLPNRWIIHCRGPRYHFDSDPAIWLATCLRNVLQLAVELSVHRVAVPAISTGVYGYPAGEAVPILVAEARQHARRCPLPDEIRFVVRTADMQALFDRAIRGLPGGMA